ncbi:hypothetical protein OPT61_g5310 [Boeremia exigua]|uniref:Uncharacterized protein n=1 Tax=Boeremia exigua TaxID=749465 RepID=A0ACC2IB43_9PLEO|nr:hypothetical protein OPT61_g5310 [Boeremia exigua]
MSFNVQRCIDLHNTIVAHGIAQLPEELVPTVTRNWFTAYNVDQTNPDLDFEMTEPLAEFLSGIDIVLPRGHVRRLAFTPFLVGICSPAEMVPEIWEMFPGYGQFILLYKNIGEDPGGLSMFLNTHGVGLLETCEDEPSECSYIALETALKSYLDYINLGKFVVDTSDERSGYGDELACEGWRYEGYLPVELETTLDIWANLVDLITSRMPGSPSTETEDVLIPLSVLDQHPSIPLFARAFLSRAKKPPFRMIAPELLVPDEEFVHRVGSHLDLLYAPATDPLQLRCPTANFLLFPWDTPGVPFVSRDDEDRWVLNRRLLDDRAGLYLTPDELMANTIAMLLPFPIGRSRYVLRSDGGTNEKAAHDILYLHGSCNPSLPAHGTPLEAVLSTWYDLVNDGTWPVNADGVAGGEGKWRLADTREHAGKFQAAIHCQPLDEVEENAGGITA